MNNEIFKKALLVDLSISVWQGRRYDKTATTEVAEKRNMEVSRGRYNKCLVRPESLKGIMKAVNALKAYYYDNSVPWTDQGLRMIRADCYFDFLAKITELKQDLSNEVDRFLAKYPEEISEARKSLKDLFNLDEYPSLDEIRKKFNVSLNFYPLPSSDHLIVEMAEEGLKEIKENIEQSFKKSINHGIKELLKRLYKVTSYMAARLAAGTDFRNSLVENVRELVAIVPKLNVTENEELKQITDEIERELTKFSSQELKENADIKNSIQAKAEEIAKKLEGMF